MRGVWLAVSLADCVAVYMYDVDTPAVGIVHAGWRGTLKRAASSCVEQMSKGFGTNPSRIRVLFGPGIGSCCFEVSRELASQFEEAFPGSSCERRVDLLKANRIMLQELGTECQPKDPPCTSCNPHYFFSHRRDSGVTGRMLAIISLET